MTEKKVHVSEVKNMIDQNIISYEQAALVFNISVMGVYQKFNRMKKGTLVGVYLESDEVERLKIFLKEFDDFIDSLIDKSSAVKNRIGGDA